MTKTDKVQLLEMVISQLQKDLGALIDAAKANLEAATNEESQPENEYDTRALEASYIAGAQSKRAQEIEESIALLKQVQVRSFAEDDSIAMTALIQVRDESGLSTFFLIPRGAGLFVEFEGQKIKILSAKSPLGSALVGQGAGDLIQYQAAKGFRECEIISVN
jgi:transcription elongation GreA/GreB family factor